VSASVFNRIRDYRAAKVRSSPWSKLADMPDYVLTVDETRQLLRELHGSFFEAVFGDLEFLSDAELKSHINTKGMTCFGIPIKIK